MSDTPDILVTSLRQYRHNNSSEMIFGFDYEETILIVSELEKLALLATARQQTINRIKTHLESINERGCSLTEWNLICDALGEIGE